MREDKVEAVLGHDVGGVEIKKKTIGKKAGEGQG